jgi:hypothetical protein
MSHEVYCRRQLACLLVAPVCARRHPRPAAEDTVETCGGRVAQVLDDGRPVRLPAVSLLLPGAGSQHPLVRRGRRRVALGWSGARGS